jgi:hypothetical protein
MLIGISGIKRSGKDTIANVLIKDFGFKKIAFADKLKDICARVFDLPVSVFHRDDFKDMVFEAPVIIDVEHIKNLVTLLEEYTSIPNDAYNALMSTGCSKTLYSPREILQFVGTDLCRNCVNDSIWLDIFNSIVKNTEGHVVVSDARFTNERNLIKSLGGTNILVSRSNLNNKDSHASENDLGDESSYDVHVKNDTTKEKLEHDIQMWYTLRTAR